MKKCNYSIASWTVLLQLRKACSITKKLELSTEFTVILKSVTVAIASE